MNPGSVVQQGKMKLKLTDSKSISMYRPDGPITPDPNNIGMALRIGNYRKSNREAKQKQ